jgi:hypothetical protein
MIFERKDRCPIGLWVRMGFKGEINYARQAISRTVPLKIYEVYLDTAPD